MYSKKLKINALQTLLTMALVNLKTRKMDFSVSGARTQFRHPKTKNLLKWAIKERDEPPVL
jgi:hypothetical protein